MSGSAVRLYTSWGGTQFDGKQPLVIDEAREWKSGQWLPVDNPVYVTGWFENDSQNNHWQSRPKGAIGDRGSSWTAFKSYFQPSSAYVDARSNTFGTIRGYRGPVMIHTSDYFGSDDFRLMDFGASDETDLLGLGATAISKVLPTNPISDLPTALGELLNEGLPRAIGSQFLKRRRISPDEISGEYLNYTFGIAPFIRDMQAFGRATQRAKELIDEYSRRAGKLIRRRYEFPLASDSTTNEWSTNGGFAVYLRGPEGSNLSPCLRPVYGGWPGVRTDVTTRSKQTWYSGAFTYYLPSSRDFASRLTREEAEMRHLFGGLSVDTAWNLLPYSWAADWITNAGDVLHNVSAFARDGLVMPWGYVMERCEFRTDSKVVGAVLGSQDTTYGHYYFPDAISTSRGAVYQRRRKATPFGFGLSESGFTPRQWSILSALGVNRFLR